MYILWARKRSTSTACVFRYVTDHNDRPFRNLEKRTEESVAYSDRLGNTRKSGESPNLFGVVRLSSRLHLPANSSYFRFIRTFQELRDISLVW